MGQFYPAGMLGATKRMSNYNEKLDEGQEYQDYVALVLFEHGIVLTNFQTKKYQLKYGENKQGIEIKRDGRFRETNNLYIETEEKSDACNPFFVESGILRKDNAWLFVIGDEQTIYIFSKTILVGLFNTKKYRMTETETSKGMLLPLKIADKYCAKKIQIGTEPQTQTVSVLDLQTDNGGNLCA